jgi:hypothetical protein
MCERRESQAGSRLQPPKLDKKGVLARQKKKGSEIAAL